jgi:hypothetical protein
MITSTDDNKWKGLREWWTEAGQTFVKVQWLRLPRIEPLTTSTLDQCQ